MINFKNKNSLCKELGYNNLKPCLEKLKFLEKNKIKEFFEKTFKKVF